MGGQRPAPPHPPWSVNPSSCGCGSRVPFTVPVVPLSVLSRRFGPAKATRPIPPGARRVAVAPSRWNWTSAHALARRLCLVAVMALCMPSRPPEWAGIGVPWLSVPRPPTLAGCGFSDSSRGARRGCPLIDSTARWVRREVPKVETLEPVTALRPTRPALRLRGRSRKVLPSGLSRACVAAWSPLPVLAAPALGTWQVLTHGRQCHVLLQGTHDWPAPSGAFRCLCLAQPASVAGGGLVPSGADREAGVSGPRPSARQ